MIRPSKEILSALQTIQQRLLQAEMEYNGAKARLRDKVKALLKVEAECLGLKKKPVRLSHLQHEVAKLREESESLGVLEMSLKEDILSLQRELTLADVYERDIGAYLNFEAEYFENIKDVSRIVEAIGKLMSHLRQLSPNLKSIGDMANVVGGLMNKEELREIDFEKFLKGEVLQDEENRNQTFRENIYRRFHVEFDVLPTGSGQELLDEWNKLWRDIHHKLFSRYPSSQQSPDRNVSTFRKISSSHPPDSFETRRVAGGKCRT
ncbi:MAG: hypothetical protein ACLQVJ_12335 [Syntrophobacteraceae bacterium]